MLLDLLVFDVLDFLSTRMHVDLHSMHVRPSFNAMHQSLDLHSIRPSKGMQDFRSHFS